MNFAVPKAPAIRCVLVHGYVDGPSVWARLAALLTAQGIEVDAVRLAPVGEPDAPSGRLLEAYARQVRAFGERGDDARPLVLVGHSMGGGIVELAAAQGIASLAGMVLLTPAPLRGVPLSPAVVQRFEARAGLTDRDEIRAGKRGLAVSLDTEAQDILAECTLSTGADFAREQLRAWTGGHPAGQDAACVSTPVLMVTTDDQFFTAAALAQEAKRFARCEVTHVSGAGHWPHLEQPQRLAAALSAFLAGIAAQPVRA